MNGARWTELELEHLYQNVNFVDWFAQVRGCSCLSHRSDAGGPTAHVPASRGNRNYPAALIRSARIISSSDRTPAGRAIERDLASAAAGDGVMRLTSDRAKMDAFADLLAEGYEPAPAALMLGWVPEHGQTMLDRICKKLGRQAR